MGVFSRFRFWPRLVVDIPENIYRNSKQNDLKRTRARKPGKISLGTVKYLIRIFATVHAIWVWSNKDRKFKTCSQWLVKHNVQSYVRRTRRGQAGSQPLCHRTALWTSQKRNLAIPSTALWDLTVLRQACTIPAPRRRVKAKAHAVTTRTASITGQPQLRSPASAQACFFSASLADDGHLYRARGVVHECFFGMLPSLTIGWSIE